MGIMALAGLLCGACSPGSIGVPDAGEDAKAGEDGLDGWDGQEAQDGQDGQDAGADPGADPGGDPGGDPGSGHSCAQPALAWLLCEDFERGQGDFAVWLSGSAFLDSPGASDRGRVRLSSEQPHAGGFALVMPAEAASGYQGASLDWYACDGEPRVNCPLQSFERLHLRVWIRFAPDHRYVHHFLNLGGSQPDDFWYHGTAGCLPNGVLHMGTTVDFEEGSHRSFFYTYFPEMACDTRCERYMDVDRVCRECLAKGLPTCEQQPQCCWGNGFAPDPPVAFPVGTWFCFEMMMRANTPGQHDGAMAYWVDGVLAHEVTGMLWRVSPTLALNRARLQHYIETEDAQGFSNRVWFDDLVISTEPIGCR